MRGTFTLPAFVLCLLAGCAVDDELTVKRSPSGPLTVPEHFKSMLDRQPDVGNATRQLESRCTLLFDYTDLVAGSDGTVSYRLPYRNNDTGQVEGCLTYRTDDDLLFGSALLPERLSMPQDFDLDAFRSLPDGPRYLTSAWFKVLRRKGLDVANALTSPADSVDAAEREKRHAATATRGLVYNPAAIDCAGDHLCIEIIYGMMPLVSTENDYEFYVTSLTPEYRKEIALDFTNMFFPGAEKCTVSLNVAPVLRIDVCNGRYFNKYKLEIIMPGFVAALADAYVDAGLQAFFYDYEYYAYFCQLPKPELWTEVEDNPRQGGGGYSGRDDYDDGNDDTPVPPQPDPKEELKNEIITTLMHPKFIERLDSAGLKPKYWLGEIDIEVDLEASGNAPNSNYSQLDKQLTIGWEAMNTRELTIIDMESCVFHECVHAKQDFVDKIELEYEEKGEIMRHPYDIYYTDKTWEEAKQKVNEDFASVYDLDNLSEEKYQTLYQSFYILCRMPEIERSYKEHVPVIEEYNKEQTKMEVEAYELQLQWYGKYMSPEYKIENNLQEYKERYNQIKDQ